MSEILFGNRGSTCTQRILFLAAEKGIDFRYEEVGWDQLKGPENLARQPFGKVPSFQDGDFHFYESRAICKYLDDKHSGHKLQPPADDLKSRAVLDQWISLESTTFAPELSTIISQRIWGTWRGLAADEAKCKAASENLQKPFEVLEKQLEGKKFICGDYLTLVDIFIAPPFFLFFSLPEGKAVLEKFKNVAGYWERISSHPSWLKAAPKH